VPLLSAERIERHVADLCSIGNRFAGTPGEAAARELIRRRFEESGLSGVRLEELDLVVYRPGAASCRIAGVDGELPCAGLQFTAAGAAEADFVYLGGPRSIADIQALEAEGVVLEGKLAVLDTYWPYLFGHYVSSAGAAGIVVVSPDPDGVISQFSGRFYPPPAAPHLPVPGVTLSRPAWTRLLALNGARPRRLRIEHEAEYELHRSANVVGEVSGTGGSDERVVVGAHYDTQLAGVGACDNATGIAALIDIARACSAEPRQRTVVFVAFADEEHGLVGSTDYCRRHAGTLDRTIGMICLDALAWVYPATRSLHADPSMQEFAAWCAAEAGWDPEEIVDASLLVGSDHNAFIDAGVPSAWFWHYPPQQPGYHNAGDRIEMLDFARVTAVAEAAAHTALSLADEAPPLGRSQPTHRWLDLRPQAAAPA
jgi:Iap family predicted aminopeptidase